MFCKQNKATNQSILYYVQNLRFPASLGIHYQDPKSSNIHGSSRMTSQPLRQANETRGCLGHLKKLRKNKNTFILVIQRITFLWFSLKSSWYPSFALFNLNFVWISCFFGFQRNPLLALLAKNPYKTCNACKKSIDSKESHIPLESITSECDLKRIRSEASIQGIWGVLYFLLLCYASDFLRCLAEPRNPMRSKEARIS